MSDEDVPSEIIIIHQFLDRLFVVGAMQCYNIL